MTSTRDPLRRAPRPAMARRGGRVAAELDGDGAVDGRRRPAAAREQVRADHGADRRIADRFRRAGLAPDGELRSVTLR